MSFNFPQADERKKNFKLDKILNAPSVPASNLFLKSNTFNMEPDILGGIFKKGSPQSSQLLSNFNLKPLVIGQTASPLKKEISFDHISTFFNNKSPSKTFGTNQGEHLPSIKNNAQSQDILPKLQTQKGSSRNIATHHTLSKSSLQGNATSKSLHNGSSSSLNQNNLSLSSIQSPNQTNQIMNQAQNATHSIFWTPLNRPNSKSIQGNGRSHHFQNNQSSIFTFQNGSQRTIEPSINNQSQNKKIVTQNSTVVSSRFLHLPNEIEKQNTHQAVDNKQIEYHTKKDHQDQKGKTFYHSSLRNIEISDENKLAESQQQQKKIISFQTSNAMLPQSFVNFKIMERQVTRQLQSSTSISLSNDFHEINAKREKIGRTHSFQKNLDQNLHSQNSNENNQGLLNESSHKLEDDEELEQLNKINGFITSNEQAKKNKQNEVKDLELKDQGKEVVRHHHHKFVSLSSINNHIQPSKDNGKSKNCGSNRKIEHPSNFGKEIDNNEGNEGDNSTKPVSEIIEEFNQTILSEGKKSTSSIGKAIQFYFPNISCQHICSTILNLFSNALTQALDQSEYLNSIEKLKQSNDQNNLGITNNNNQINKKQLNSQNKTIQQGINFKKNKNTLKIPEKLFFMILNILKDNVLALKYNFSKQNLQKFELMALNQLVILGLGTSNFFEELGGENRCKSLIQEFLVLLGQELQINHFDKEAEDICWKALDGDKNTIQAYAIKIKSEQVVSQKDIFQLKHCIFSFFLQNEQFIDEKVKQRCFQILENIRHTHFSPIFVIDSDSIVTDAKKYISTKIPIQEYFQEEQNDERVEIFIIQVYECLFYRLKPSDIAAWLPGNIKKPIDDSFFKMIVPLLLEPFRRRNVQPTFLKKFDLKFFWLKMHLNLTFDTSSFLSRLDELLNNIRLWIDAMVASKQLQKQQLSKLDQIQNTNFLKCFIEELLCEDVFNISDTLLQLASFKTDSDSVLFQLKGFKRVLLSMKFKTNEAYDIAEFFIKIFTEAYQQ